MSAASRGQGRARGARPGRPHAGVPVHPPAPYFPALAAGWGTIPLRKELIEAGGPDWWANPATRIGNGPFRLVAYNADGPDQRVVYARNDAYWGGPTKLDGIEFSFIDSGDPEMEAYRKASSMSSGRGRQMIPALEADPVLSRDLRLAARRRDGLLPIQSDARAVPGPEGAGGVRLRLRPRGLLPAAIRLCVRRR